MNSKSIVIVAGCICLDIIPDLEDIPKGDFFQIFKPGRVILADGAQFSTGGSVSNTGLALHHLGIPTKLIAKIGNDYIGQIILNLIRNFSDQLTNEISIDYETSSSYSLAISPPGIDRIFIYCPGTNDNFSSKDIPPGIFENAALFHFGYPPVMKQFYLNQGREIIEIFNKAKTCGVTTSLDMAFPDPSSESGKSDWRTILAKSLPFVDFFMPSIEELLFFLRKDLFDQFNNKGSIIDLVTTDVLSDLSNELLDMGAKIILIKLGSNGLYMRSGKETALKKIGKAQPQDLGIWSNREMWTPCYKVNVAGTTGSGDVTIAGFLSAFLHGMNPEQALLSAVAVGACSVEAPNSLNGLITWDETQLRIQKGWERLPATMDVCGWSCENNYDVWQSSAKKLVR